MQNMSDSQSKRDFSAFVYLRDYDCDWSFGRQDSLQTTWRRCFGCKYGEGILGFYQYFMTSVANLSFATYRPSSNVITVEF
jgi:hypothetical protein